MTTLAAGPPVQEQNLWATMPGWGIVADLTPPELIAARRLRSLRKVIAIALAVVVLLCAGGYVYAFFRDSSAQDSVDAAQNQTVTLTATQGRYTRVTKIEGATKSINDQVSTLMANDVDVAGLVQTLRLALPPSMSLTSMNLTVDSTGAGASGTGAATGAGTTTTVTTDPSGTVTTIGTVTLSGAARSFGDVATYVTRLSSLKGITQVVPTSNASNGRNGTWNIVLQLTDALHTHRYDAGKTGGTR